MKECMVLMENDYLAKYNRFSTFHLVLLKLKERLWHLNVFQQVTSFLLYNNVIASWSVVVTLAVIMNHVMKLTANF